MLQLRLPLVLRLKLNYIMSNLGTTLNSSIDPTTPAIGPVSTRKEDISVWLLQSLEVLGSQLGRGEEPSAVGEFVLVPVMGDLEKQLLEEVPAV